MSRFLFFLFYTASQGDQNKSALCINYHIKKLFFEKVLFTSKKPKFMIFDMLPKRPIIPSCGEGKFLGGSSLTPPGPYSYKLL